MPRPAVSYVTLPHVMAVRVHMVDGSFTVNLDVAIKAAANRGAGHLRWMPSTRGRSEEIAGEHAVHCI